MLAWSGGGVLWRRRALGVCVEPMAPSELAPDFDERLAVEQAQSGDQEALSTLYSFYFPRVYRYVAGRVRSTQDAEDVTEEVFLKLVANLKRYEWRGLPFGAWVFRIARNEVVSHARRQRRRGIPAQLSETMPDDRQDHVAAYELQATIEVVREATAKLPPAQRDVISLRFGAGLSVAETALALGKTQNNVKVLQHKAIAKLQGMVAEE
ncbi:MAG: sigma-70 family RNA polymerase sigma factor [Dehalococcoidia bacterium]|nr:sigma-70 family RNA polymerase sigma factor [Dehalococcoidia bacterium]MYD27393.1 sigma-70 family RNA polymerase sigma factor [Dehalococcoidia bacterium]